MRAAPASLDGSASRAAGRRARAEVEVMPEVDRGDLGEVEVRRGIEVVACLVER